MNLIKFKTSYLLLFICFYSYGQIDQYHYKRELQGITDQWHTIELPNELFGNVSYNLSDIRIYGINTDNDTIEAPYILRVLSEKTVHKKVNFETINNSHTGEGYYVTFKIPIREAINQIQLDFKQDNFDWRIALEGSQDLQKWFQILDNYRILSIKNKQTDYQFTKVNFPNSNYKYFRLLIRSNKKPELITTKISLDTVSDSNLRNYILKNIKITEKKSAQQTVIDVDLERPVPVSTLTFNMANIFDYYRPGSLTTLHLQNEQVISKKEIPITEPLFKNKIWLWAIMIIIILVLGWFSLKMMRKG